MRRSTSFTCSSTAIRAAARSWRYRLARLLVDPELAEKGHRNFGPSCTASAEAGTTARWTASILLADRRPDGFDEQALAALRDLVPVLGLAVKSAAQIDIRETLGRSISGATREQVLRGRDNGGRDRAHQFGALVFRSAAARLRSAERHDTRRDHPVSHDYAQAAIGCDP